MKIDAPATSRKVPGLDSDDSDDEELNFSGRIQIFNTITYLKLKFMIKMFKIFSFDFFFFF
jgi:hypothetical protein